ncbi:MAG TPA: hypothetical protein VMK66_20665 [Myxococcales bacterium]|nr:hypothetical protein [Myxococcales bacterium]
MRFALGLWLCAGAALADNLVQDPGSPWPSSVDTPRATSMGGAHSAIATGNDALAVNPAGLAQNRRYHAELDGMYDSRFPAQAVLVSLVDAASSPVATGLLWSRWASGQPAGRGEGWSLGLGYSGSVSPGIFIGGETKYLRFYTPDGLVQKFAQDIGFLARKGNVAWAAVLQNIATDKIPLFPLTATAGVAWGTDTTWHLSFDYKADLSDTSNVKNKLALGGEVLLGESIALRGGATWDTTNKLWWISAGVGLLTEKGGLQLVWRRRVEGPYDQFFEGGLTVYLE